MIPKENKLRPRAMIFEQQLKPEYWDWPPEKQSWLNDPLKNKALIFQEIYQRILTIEGEKEPVKIALIIHDKDQNPNKELIAPHLHGYVEFGGQRTLDRLTDCLGIKSQYIEPAGSNGGNKWGKINSQAYLIHAKQPEKFQYSPDEVETFGTFDYNQFIQENIADFEKLSAKRKHAYSDESLDLVIQKIQVGNLSFENIMLEDDLYFLYANNRQKVRDALDSFGERKAWQNLDALKKGKYALTVLYIQGRSGIGKSYLANKIAEEACLYAHQNGYKNAQVYSASASNPFDDYFGEEIIKFDDLRPQSLSNADWLKVLDPLNSSRISARYKNKLIASRLVIITHTENPENFFSRIPNEDVNQYMRRIHYKIGISEKQFQRTKHDNFYSLTEMTRQEVPTQIRLSGSTAINLDYGFEGGFSDDNSVNFTNKLLENYLLPRIFPAGEKQD